MIELCDYTFSFRAVSQGDNLYYSHGWHKSFEYGIILTLHEYNILFRFINKTPVAKYIDHNLLPNFF